MARRLDIRACHRMVINITTLELIRCVIQVYPCTEHGRERRSLLPRLDHASRKGRQLLLPLFLYTQHTP